MLNFSCINHLKHFSRVSWICFKPFRYNLYFLLPHSHFVYIFNCVRIIFWPIERSWLFLVQLMFFFWIPASNKLHTWSENWICSRLIQVIESAHWASRKHSAILSSVFLHSWHPQYFGFHLTATAWCVSDVRMPSYWFHSGFVHQHSSIIIILLYDAGGVLSSLGRLNEAKQVSSQLSSD